MKIKTLVGLAAILLSSSVSAQSLVKDYVFNDLSTGAKAGNFNFTTLILDNKRVLKGSTEDRSGNFDFHLTLHDHEGNILWDMLHDFSGEDYLTSLVKINKNYVAVVGTYDNGTEVRGKVLVIDENNGSIFKELDLKVPGRDIYLLASDYSANLDELVVAGFVADQTSDIITAPKEAYAIGLDVGLNQVWTNSFNSGAGNDSYNMFSRCKYIEVNGKEHIYLTGSVSYMEPYPSPSFPTETQSVASLLLTTGGTLVWDKSFTSNWGGHMTFGVDVLDNKNKDELILLSQDTETHDSFITVIDKNGIIQNFYQYSLHTKINNFARDLEWVDYGDSFMIAGYLNHGDNNYKAYMMEVSTNWGSNLDIMNMQYLKHDLYHYDLACSNKIFKPHIALGAIRPFIYNSEMIARDPASKRFYLFTGLREDFSTNYPITTRMWRYVPGSGIDDCIDKFVSNDLVMNTSYVNPLKKKGLQPVLQSLGKSEEKQNTFETLICGKEEKRLAAPTLQELNLDIIDSDLVLETEESAHYKVRIIGLSGKVIFQQDILVEDLAILSLEDISLNGLYIIEVTNRKTNTSHSIKHVW